MLSRVLVLLSLVMVVFGATMPARAAESDPIAAIRTFNDRILVVMKAGPSLGFKGRADKYRIIVTETYDMGAITKAMLGVSSSKLSAEEMSRLVTAYTDFSAATYAAQFDDWDGERFDVGEAHPSHNGAVVVQSWIVPKTGEGTQIDYVTRQEQGQWRIVDVLFDGTVSQVAVRRSEFGSIFRSKGFAGLLETIEKQTAALEKK